MSANGDGPLDVALATGGALTDEELKACCANVYAHPAIRWLLGDELHPGGEGTTRRSLELIGLGPGERLLDVASGSGASALLGAREFGAEVVGVEYGLAAVAEASAAAAEQGLVGVEFVQGDAERLPVPDRSFDAALCECSLCTFPDKERAISELHRALRPGGRVVISDVVADERRLPRELRGTLATIACVGSALPEHGYADLLDSGGFELLVTEPCPEDVEKFAERVEDRLRGARLLGLSSPEAPIAIDDALLAIRAARTAIAEGTLGYAIFGAVRR